MNDMEKASQIGIPAYNAEQEEKRKLLDFLLSHPLVLISSILP